MYEFDLGLDIYMTTYIYNQWCSVNHFQHGWISRKNVREMKSTQRLNTTPKYYFQYAINPHNWDVMLGSLNHVQKNKTFTKCHSQRILMNNIILKAFILYWTIWVNYPRVCYSSWIHLFREEIFTYYGSSQSLYNNIALHLVNIQRASMFQ